MAPLVNGAGFCFIGGTQGKTTTRNCLKTPDAVAEVHERVALVHDRRRPLKQASTVYLCSNLVDFNLPLQAHLGLIGPIYVGKGHHLDTCYQIFELARMWQFLCGERIARHIGHILAIVLMRLRCELGRSWGLNESGCKWSQVVARLKREREDKERQMKALAIKHFHALA